MSVPTITPIGDGAPGDPTRVPRDHHERPLVLAPGAENPKPYTRVTTFIKAIESAEGLAKWREAMVVLGAGRDPMTLLRLHVLLGLLDGDEPWDDYKAVKTMQLVDGTPAKPHLWKAIEALKTAAGIDHASLYGTLVHDLTEEWEKHDGARSPAQVVDGAPWLVAKYVEGMAGCSKVPDPAKVVERATADLAGYAKVRAHFSVLAVEKFVALHELEVGGTLDRHLGYDGAVLVGDMKTGDSAVSFPGKLALQLGTYAIGKPYSPAEGTTEFPYPVSRTWGLVLHFAGDGQCIPLWVKIGRAIDTVQSLIPAARAWESYAGSRKGGRPTLLRPFEPGAGVPKVDGADELPPLTGDLGLSVPSRTLEAAIRSAGSRAQLVEIWRATGGEHWPPALTELSQARAHELALAAVPGEVISDRQHAA